MTNKTPIRKSVVRTDLWLHSSFEESLSREADIDLSICPIKASAAEAGAMLANAHAFHVSPAKDELPAHLFTTPTMLQACPRLLVVSSAGAGFDTIDVDACTAAGVAVVNQAGGNAVSVAEMAIGLMLDVSRRISECDRRLRRERGFPREDVMGRELNGKTLGVVGIGHTGSRVAALGRAFGMTVLAVDPFLGRDEIVRRGAEPVTHDQLLSRADFVSLHCPRDASTMGMIDAAAFAHMKQGAIFISTARGGIHDEAALAAALASGHLAGAGLDVWHPEPPPLDHPLLAMDNVVATYHTAGVTHEARRNVASMGATQIIGALKGERPPRLINPQVWPEYAGRFARIFGPACGQPSAGVDPLQQANTKEPETRTMTSPSKPFAGRGAYGRALLLATSLLMTGVAGAQGQYPDRPIRFIVPQAPGSATDTVSRIVATELGPQLGQQVVIENRPGGAFTIGLDLVAKAAPDGYVIGMGPVGALSISPNMMAKLPYDIEKDFQPVALVSIGNMLLAVSPKVQATTVAELIALARANPGKLTNASSANGSPGHVGAELFKILTGTQIVHVPYKGGALAINDLMAGQVDMMIESLNSIAPHARSGKVRALAVTGAKRSPAFPNIPTIAEAGVAGYEAPTFTGVIAPAGLPKPVLDKLNAAINRALNTASFKERFGSIGDEAMGGTPEEFAATIRRESARWRDVVKRSGAKLE